MKSDEDSCVWSSAGRIDKGESAVKISVYRGSVAGKICSGMLLVALLLLSTGCFSGTRRETLTVLWWGDVYNAAFAKKLIDAYNATGPRLPARLVTVQGTAYAQKILTMAASGTMPDVALLNNRDARSIGARGALMDLAGMTAQPEFRRTEEAMWPRVMEGAKSGNKVFGIPIWTWTPGIYYNKELFDKAGLGYPDNDWTWEDFMQAAERLTIVKNGRKVQYGIIYGLSLTDNIFMSYIYSHGGEIYSKDMKRCLLDSEETLAAVRSLADYKLKRGIAPTEAESAGLQAGVLADAFQSGKVAMRMSGRDAVDVLTQGGISFPWGAAPMPRGPKGAYRFTTQACLSVASKTEHFQEAWNFISFVVSSKGQRIITADRSDVSVLKAAAYEDDYVNYKDRPDVNIMFRDILQDARPCPYMPGSEEWLSFALNRFQLVEVGSLSVEEACRQIASRYNKK